MNKPFTFKESPPPLLRIHIDDISNIKPMNADILPKMKEWLSKTDIRIAKDNTHIVIPSTSSCLVIMNDILSTVKALMEIGDTDIQYDGGEKALDMYYEASSCILYWDTLHTKRVFKLSMNASMLIREEIERRIINAIGSHIVFYDRGIMLIDAHIEYEVIMGRIRRVCDMVSYEISPNPCIESNKDQYVSYGDSYYFSIYRINP